MQLIIPTTKYCESSRCSRTYRSSWVVAKFRRVVTTKHNRFCIDRSHYATSRLCIPLLSSSLTTFCRQTFWCRSGCIFGLKAVLPGWPSFGFRCASLHNLSIDWTTTLFASRRFFFRFALLASALWSRVTLLVVLCARPELPPGLRARSLPARCCSVCRRVCRRSSLR